jgi:pimeloyl-ACP methyl ester carboxylesterase
MKARKARRAALALFVCIAGFILARATPYTENTAIIDASGCRLVTDVVEPATANTEGSVVLLHGIAANKKIMSYLAHAFAEQGLRVFVPDLPGHGRTQGPFSFERAESCTESLMRELTARRAIDPARTILAGHSMGGAIALRVAAHVGVAGVVSISPAPMRAPRGVRPGLLPYQNPPPTPDNTLVISAAWEPFGIREAARELVAPTAANGKFLLIPRATHVSVLFDPRAARASQDWAAQVLHLQATTRLPSLQPLFGSFIGFAGILFLAGPFIRETLGAGEQPQDALKTDSHPAATAPANPASEWLQILRPFVEVPLAASLAVVVLKFWDPFSFLHLFNGDYFASFLLLTGLVLLLLHHKSVSALIAGRPATLLGAAFAALVLHFLITGWFDLTLTEAWASLSRWARFPILFLAAVSYLAAEELLLPSSPRSRPLTRFLAALALRLLAWLPLTFALFVLHSGAILLILLAPFFLSFFVLQLLGMQVVRKQTQCPLAAAIFGAILLAGFCLVIFPVT